jgi:hypothetical protein
MRIVTLIIQSESKRIPLITHSNTTHKPEELLTRSSKLSYEQLLAAQSNVAFTTSYYVIPSRCRYVDVRL